MTLRLTASLASRCLKTNKFNPQIICKISFIISSILSDYLTSSWIEQTTCGDNKTFLTSKYDQLLCISASRSLQQWKKPYLFSLYKRRIDQGPEPERPASAWLTWYEAYQWHFSDQHQFLSDINSSMLYLWISNVHFYQWIFLMQELQFWTVFFWKKTWGGIQWNNIEIGFHKSILCWKRNWEQKTARSWCLWVWFWR